MTATAYPVEAVTAAILAGGEGRRLGGRDKGLVPLAGRPLVAWVHDALRGQASTIVVCANRSADDYAPYGRVIADSHDGFLGPLAGISAALDACTTPWLLTVPVDSPRPPRDLGARLHAAIGGHDAAVARPADGRREPLFALYRRTLAASAAGAAQAACGVWQWQDRCGAVEVGFAAADGFVNLNTEDDFQRWEAGAHG